MLRAPGLDTGYSILIFYFIVRKEHEMKSSSVEYEKNIWLKYPETLKINAFRDVAPCSLQVVNVS
jgi:hypothetical protein